MVRIENWSVTDNGPYCPPEMQEKRLQGKVYGYPGRPDGDEVVTSPITGANGRIIDTVSRQYKLGSIDPGYRKWIEENYEDWDWRNPIKIHD